MTENANMLVCANCGKPAARLRHVSRSFGHGDSLLVIENIPVISCTACGETYLTPETLDEIDRIQRERRTAAVVKPVPVAEFAG
jgi:YgiT-type zinc finger domain-containing protein